MMAGRRYSEGLHQALEAKEQVEIQRENQTLASITFQNLFRMYPKLAGMTGTAMTEAAEFGEIYGLEVVEIPTNVTVVLARHSHVGRDLDDLQAIDLAELCRLGHRRAGHAGQLGIHAEQVLEGDRGQRLVLALDLDLLLGLERLVQAFRVAPAGHHAAGELVDDDDLAVLDDIVYVAGEQLVGPQRLRDVMQHRDLGRGVEADALGQQAVAAQDILDRLDTGVGQDDRAVLLVLLEMIGLEARDHGIGAAVEFRGILGRAGDDERRARLVDQDRIDLVDDGVVEGPLGHGVQPVLHVVAQVVEAQLVVGAVGDVAGVGRLAFLVAQLVNDHADAETEELVDLAHPLGVALGEIVV